MTHSKNVIHLLSGGLDSTVMLYDLLAQGCDVHCVLFHYGQKHAWRELPLAISHCTWNGVKFTQIELPKIEGSTLTGGIGSHVVPNRNAILLNHAVALAVKAGAESVTYGCNKDDAAGFPDCRDAFVQAINVALLVSEIRVEVCAPYINLTKREIVSIGQRLGVPFEDTYSCYEGSEVPCGACGACLKRAEALA